MDTGGLPQERRLAERWQHVSEIFCYINGLRFDARSADVSSTGMFLETEVEVPAGSRLAIVFKEKDDESLPPVFLVGQVVRTQAAPKVGLGLRWEKAVTEGPALSLTFFLSRVLKVAGEVKIHQPAGPKDKLRAIHFFPAPRPAGAPSATPPPIPLDLGTVPPDEARRPPGPLTSVIRRRDMWPSCEIPARLVTRQAAMTGKIRSMGLNGLYIKTDGATSSLADPIWIEFEVLTARGFQMVRMECGISFLEHDDLELAVLNVDEGGMNGLLKRYVRWLHFRNISATE